MKVFTEPKKIQKWCKARKLAGKKIALVPTMGYLHEGHLSLIAKAKRKGADEIVVSVFVNPVQFCPGEDYEKYPRDEKADLAKCRAAGATAVFFPTPANMYLDRHSVYVNEEDLSKGLCGARCPGHFRGVCTVVAKLFNLAHPDFAVFGQKDYHQAQVIKRMVRDLNFDLEIVVAPIVREPSGLARSSRNTYLSAEEKEKALAISKNLLSLKSSFSSASRTSRKTSLATVAANIEKAGLRLDYLSCVDAETLEPRKKVAQESRKGVLRPRRRLRRQDAPHRQHPHLTDMLASVRRISFAWVALVAGASAVAANVVTLENARYRVGVDLDRGGMVSNFVDKRGNATLNLVHGNGIQPTFRGNGYTAVINAKPVAAYNVLSAGCSLAIANDNKVVNAENGQPLNASAWLQYDLHDDYLTVAVSFLDKTDNTNGAYDHELPALYAVPSLSTFTCCQAADGWVGAELSSWAKPGFWGGNSEAYKTIASDERWCAWTNPTTGRGLGVYSPSAGTILMGRMTDGSCSYAAPLAHSAVKSGVTVGYVYYLAAGTVAEMRDVFAAIRFGLGADCLGTSGVRIDGANGKLGVVAFDPLAGQMVFSGRFVSFNGVLDSEDFALVCRSSLVDRASEFLLPVDLSVEASGENELAAVAMSMDDPPSSLFVMGVSERPSPYRTQMVEKGFPTDYADLMAALHERHPQWEFEPLFVSDMTWDAVIDKEMVPSRNLVAHSTWAPSPWNTLGLANYTPYYAENAKAYDSGSFYQASRESVAYFMDPRNFLNDTEVFMFETLAFNEGAQTLAAIEKALAGSFMANACFDGGTKKFSELILSVGQELGVNPVFLAGRLKSEQGNGTVQAQGTIGDSLWELYADADGKVGTSNVWGTNYTKDNQATANVIAKGKAYYNGYYNLFNMGASGTGLFEIRYNAWKEAAEAPAKYHGPWTSQEKALYGGSVKVKERYIDTYRHTSYLQKFSVLAEAGSSRWSQYMQNIAAPLTESRSTKAAYVASGAYEDAHVFLVPVYRGIPDASCPDPANGNSVYSPTK